MNTIHRCSRGIAHPPLRLVAIIMGVLAFLPLSAWGHDVNMTRVRAKFAGDSKYQIELYYDVDAWTAGARTEHMTEDDLRRLREMSAGEREQRLKELEVMLGHRIRIRFDDVVAAPRIEIHELAVPMEASDPRQGTPIRRIVRMSGDVPKDAKVFDFWASRSFGIIALEIQGEEPNATHQELVERGARSSPYQLNAPQVASSWWSVAGDYVRLGFEHILPKGLDHILFVLGLFLLSTKLRPLLWQVTAFTVAHSVSLALSTYGIVSVSPRIVEPLIALSIVFVAVENLISSKLHSWRIGLVFCFGLLHGLGFAGVLSELGLPRDQFVTALIAFNVGVELGQLAVIGLAFLAVGWIARRSPKYRQVVVVPASAVIALVAIYWTVERTIPVG